MLIMGMKQSSDDSLDLFMRQFEIISCRGLLLRRVETLTEYIYINLIGGFGHKEAHVGLLALLKV